MCGIGAARRSGSRRNWARLRRAGCWVRPARSRCGSRPSGRAGRSRHRRCLGRGRIRRRRASSSGRRSRCRTDPALAGRGRSPSVGLAWWAGEPARPRRCSRSARRPSSTMARNDPAATRPRGGVDADGAWGCACVPHDTVSVRRHPMVAARRMRPALAAGRGRVFTGRVGDLRSPSPVHPGRLPGHRGTCCPTPAGGSRSRSLPCRHRRRGRSAGASRHRW